MRKDTPPVKDVATCNIAAAAISHTLFALDSQTPSDAGIDYKSLYYGLFNGITTILRSESTYEQTIAALKQLQFAAEDMYVNQAEVLPHSHQPNSTTSIYKP